MNKKEILQLISDLRTQFKKAYPKKTDEEIDKMILDVFFEAYVSDTMDRHDLTILTNALGYGVNEEVLDQIEIDKKEGKGKC